MRGRQAPFSRAAIQTQIGFPAKTIAFLPVIGTVDRSERNDVGKAADNCFVGIDESDDELLVAGCDRSLSPEQPRGPRDLFFASWQL